MFCICDECNDDDVMRRDKDYMKCCDLCFEIKFERHNNRDSKEQDEESEEQEDCNESDEASSISSKKRKRSEDKQHFGQSPHKKAKK